MWIVTVRTVSILKSIDQPQLTRIALTPCAAILPSAREKMQAKYPMDFAEYTLEWKLGAMCLRFARRWEFNEGTLSQSVFHSRPSGLPQPIAYAVAQKLRACCFPTFSRARRMIFMPAPLFQCPKPFVSSTLRRATTNALRYIVCRGDFASAEKNRKSVGLRGKQRQPQSGFKHFSNKPFRLVSREFVLLHGPAKPSRCREGYPAPKNKQGLNSAHPVPANPLSSLPPPAAPARLKQLINRAVSTKAENSLSSRGQKGRNRPSATRRSFRSVALIL